jgi:hypothetical protein
MEAIQPKKPYQPPVLKSVKVFLPMLSTGSGKHHPIKKPFPPFR